MTSIARIGSWFAPVCLLSATRTSSAQLPSSDSLQSVPSTVLGPVSLLARLTPLTLAADTPVVRRTRAIEYSDAYYTRLTVHRYGSYVMIPLFVAQYSLGENLMNDADPPSWMRPAHGLAAGGVAVLFGVNTITGVWNLWDSRQDPAGRTRRLVHSIAMIAADAGFLATGATAPEHEHFGNDSDYRHQVRQHRKLAVASFALSTVSGAMMWFWKQ